jgi:uncharacterized protein YukE
MAFVSATVLASAARAQNAPAQPGNATAATPQNATTTTPGTPAPAAKKVWTNEDMGAVHKDPAISTFSGTSTKPANNKPVAAKASTKSVQQYQNQIKGLQAKLPPLDAQISELQAGLNGATVNETRHYGGDKLDDWRDQLARLRKKRNDIADQIGALQDEARHNGVPDNQIP